jgi:hypothetical protein
MGHPNLSTILSPNVMKSEPPAIIKGIPENDDPVKVNELAISINNGLGIPVKGMPRQPNRLF